MNNKIFKMSVLLMLIVFVSASLHAQQGKMRKKVIDRNYNPATVETISGAVTDISNLNTWGLHVKVKTDKGIIGVHLGPQWFLKDKITILKGDNISVTGSKVKIDAEDVIIAKTVVKGIVSIQLRDDNGIPLWAGKGKGKGKFR
jgi:hypothetical protein